MTLFTAMNGVGVRAFDVFLVELERAKLYQNWRAANPGEAARFDNCVQTGVAAPMVTAFGRALVIAASNL